MSSALAMVLANFNNPLVPREIPLPDIKDGEVLVRITAAGICGTDTHIWEGQDPRSRAPMILGHEGIGIVERIMGSRRDIVGRELQEGDLITWNRGVSCGKCYFCIIKRRPYLCPNRWTYGISKSLEDYPYLNGSFATHAHLTKETELIKIASGSELEEDDYVPYVSACCAGSTVACMYDQAHVEPGDSVVIQGPGPLGIYAVAFARVRGAAKIIVVGGTPERLEMCRKAGATHVINREKTSAQERAEMVWELTGGTGASIVVETAGTVSAVEEGLKYVSRGGAYMSSGIAVPSHHVKIDWFELTKNNIAIQGIWVGDARHTYQALEIFKLYKNELKEIVSHRFKLTEANEALETMKKKAALKPVLIP